VSDTSGGPARRVLRALRDQARRIKPLAPFVEAVDRAALRWTARERYDGRDPVESAYVEAYTTLVYPYLSGRVLDLGCGHGYLTCRMAERFGVTDVVGIDRIRDFRCAHAKVRFMSQDLARAPELPAGFDVVVATEFIEHLPEAAFTALLPQISAALKPGGRFVGSTPPNPTAASTFSGSPFHEREYQPETLEALLRKVFADVIVRVHGSELMTWVAGKESR
jgi:2-polyprenyl-3-methyl-5-hydroxy-6-metoxy-1,4-benzoquinol methylase